MICVMVGVDQDLKRFSRILLQGINQVFGLLRELGIHHSDIFFRKIVGNGTAFLGKYTHVISQYFHLVRIALHKFR